MSGTPGDGLTVLDLPEPDSERYEGVDRLLYLVRECAVTVWHPNEVCLSTWVSDWEPEEPMTAAEARQLGLALIAAAERAEKMK